MAGLKCTLDSAASVLRLHEKPSAEQRGLNLPPNSAVNIPLYQQVQTFRRTRAI